jgi:TolB protein
MSGRLIWGTAAAHGIVWEGRIFRCSRERRAGAIQGSAVRQARRNRKGPDMDVAEKIRLGRGRRAALAAVLAAGTIAAAGGAAQAAVTAPVTARRPGASLAAGQVAQRAAVPWRRVGPGWVLAEYWPGRFALEGKPKAAAATVYLIDPAGGRYRLYRWAATKQPPSLVDWSGDKTRALLERPAGGLEQIVLKTGKLTRFSLAGGASAIGYTRPNGTNLLGWRQAGSDARLARYSLTGHLAKVLATGPGDGAAVYSDTGATLAVGGVRGLDLVSNAGGVIRALPVPRTSAAGCSPSRWWSSGTILATCVARGAAAPRLWLVPDSGARPKALTPQRGRHSRDLGDIGAWRLRSGLYLQGLGPCGVVQIFRQLANGSARLVTIPHVAGNSNRILTGLGSQLLVQAQTGCPGSESLLWFNPSSRHVRMLLRAPGNVVGVLGAVPYGLPADRN